MRHFYVKGTPALTSISGSQVPINLAIPCHSSAIDVADRNYNIVTGKLSKSLKKLNPAKPLGVKDFVSRTGYYTHPLESYVPMPESEVL